MSPKSLSFPLIQRCQIATKKSPKIHKCACIYLHSKLPLPSLPLFTLCILAMLGISHLIIFHARSGPRKKKTTTTKLITLLHKQIDFRMYNTHCSNNINLLVNICMCPFCNFIMFILTPQSSSFQFRIYKVFASARLNHLSCSMIFIVASFCTHIIQDVS